MNPAGTTLDLLIENAVIRTMNPAQPIARRLGVLHGRVVGLDDQLGQVEARTRIDLSGRAVLPGFIDAHAHLAWTGLAARSTDLTGCRSVQEALTIIGRAAQHTGTGEWVDVVGYDQRPLGRHLTRQDLDRVAAGHRVYVIHTSGHAHLVSSPVLQMLTSPLPPSPDVVRDDSGAPTGLFLEGATALVNALRTPYPLSQIIDALETAAQVCLSQGVTFAAEAGLGGGLSHRSPIEAGAYQDAIDAGGSRCPPS